MMILTTRGAKCDSRGKAMFLPMKRGFIYLRVQQYFTLRINIVFRSQGFLLSKCGADDYFVHAVNTASCGT